MRRRSWRGSFCWKIFRRFLCRTRAQGITQQSRQRFGLRCGRACVDSLGSGVGFDIIQLLDDAGLIGLEFSAVSVSIRGFPVLGR